MSSSRKSLLYGLPVRAHLQCSIALALLAGGLQGTDSVMEAYSRAWALNGQTITRGQAIEQFKAIIERNPRFWRAYETLAHAYVVAGEVDQGEAYFGSSPDSVIEVRALWNRGRESLMHLIL